MVRIIKVGTRGSKLALTQTEQVVNILRNKFSEIKFEIVVIRTRGDVYRNSLKESPERGLFTKEIERALLDKRIDMAVHSFKDMEVKEAEGLMVAAIPEREDVRDVLITRSGEDIFQLRKNSVIGTGSPRRISQLEKFGFKFKDVRGNVDTRLKKLEKGEFDGIVLALSGLKRLGLGKYERFALPVEVMVPSPGQGALAIEIRCEDRMLNEILREINHRESEIGAKFEKKFLEKMGGGCHLPIGAYCKVDFTGKKINFLAFFEEKGVKYKANVSAQFKEGMDFEPLFLKIMESKEVIL